jgi:hypothetical protein
MAKVKANTKVKVAKVVFDLAHWGTHEPMGLLLLVVSLKCQTSQSLALVVFAHSNAVNYHNECGHFEYNAFFY